MFTLEIKIRATSKRMLVTIDILWKSEEYNCLFINTSLLFKLFFLLNQLEVIEGFVFALFKNFISGYLRNIFHPLEFPLLNYFFEIFKLFLFNYRIFSYFNHLKAFFHFDKERTLFKWIWIGSLVANNFVTVFEFFYLLRLLHPIA